MMTSYDSFAEYYDELVDSSVEKSKRIENYIVQNNPNARIVLEIACGTGNIIGNLSEKYTKVGLDISASMLEIAKRKVRSATFYQDDMRVFQCPTKFDVILCVYDAINHLVSIEEWKQVFHMVSNQLAENGLFIFDVNTEYRLNKLTEAGPTVNYVGKDKKDVCLVTVSNLTPEIFNWQVRIFKRELSNKYHLIEANFSEVSFPLRVIEQAILKEFTSVLIEDNDHEELSCHSGRIWFICRK